MYGIKEVARMGEFVVEGAGWFALGLSVVTLDFVTNAIKVTERGMEIVTDKVFDAHTSLGDIIVKRHCV